MWYKCDDMLEAQIKHKKNLLIEAQLLNYVNVDKK